MKKIEIDTGRPEISSVSNFLEDMKTVRQAAENEKRGHTWYFRGDRRCIEKTNGEREDKPLLPSIGEKGTYCGKSLDYTAEPEREKKLFNRFRRFAYQELNGITSEWEAMFLARHYELPTRILDWSASPLVALYFSCSPKNPKIIPGVGGVSCVIPMKLTILTFLKIQTLWNSSPVRKRKRL